MLLYAGPPGVNILLNQQSQLRFFRGVSPLGVHMETMQSCHHFRCGMIRLAADLQWDLVLDHDWPTVIDGYAFFLTELRLHISGFCPAWKMNLRFSGFFLCRLPPARARCICPGQIIGCFSKTMPPWCRTCTEGNGEFFAPKAP